MDESDERVMTAIMIDIYFCACMIIAVVLPTVLGYYIAEQGNVPGYGPEGILSSVAWWVLCADIFGAWMNMILILPFYALIQAAPRGAFDFILKRSEH